MKRAPESYHHGKLRKALLDEAAKLVEREGVDALTLRELARRLGVSHAAPAHHFAGKTALLSELAADGFEELTKALDDGASRGHTPEQRLRETGRAYVAFALARPGHYRVMFGRELGESRLARLADAGACAYEALERVVAAALPAGRAKSRERVREASFLAWSSTHGAAMLLLDGPPLAGVDASRREAVIRSLIDHLTAKVAAAIAEK